MNENTNAILDDKFKKLLLSRQLLSVFLLDFNICGNCKHVYKNKHGASSCPSCHTKITNKLGYPSFTIPNIINLIQDHYRMEPCRENINGDKIIDKKESRHNYGIIILFCTFVECWMDYFINYLLKTRKTPDEIIDRLLSDNWRLDDRKGKLFKTLTGESFGDALKNITEINKKKGGNLDYMKIWDTVQDTIKKRNDIIHKGGFGKYDESFIAHCINNINGVNNLFIALHNRYIAKQP